MPTAHHGGATMIEEIDRRFRKPLLSFFRRNSHAQDAEDLTQEVLVRMLRHPGTEIESLGSYVFRVASNLLRDTARRAATRRREDGSPDPRAQASNIAVEEIEPERVLLAKERLEIAMQALMELPERTRDIFVYYRLEGMRQREIALHLGISVSAVEKHLMKAFEHIALRVDR